MCVRVCVCHIWVLRVLQVQKCHSAPLCREDHCVRALAVPLLLSISTGVLTPPFGIYHPLDMTPPAGGWVKAALVACCRAMRGCFVRCR